MAGNECGTAADTGSAADTGVAADTGSAATAAADTAAVPVAEITASADSTPAQVPVGTVPTLQQWYGSLAVFICLSLVATDWQVSCNSVDILSLLQDQRSHLLIPNPH